MGNSSTGFNIFIPHLVPSHYRHYHIGNAMKVRLFQVLIKTHHPKCSRVLRITNTPRRMVRKGLIFNKKHLTPSPSTPHPQISQQSPISCSIHLTQLSALAKTCFLEYIAKRSPRATKMYFCFNKEASTCIRDSRFPHLIYWLLPQWLWIKKAHA